MVVQVKLDDPILISSAGEGGLAQASARLKVVRFHLRHLIRGAEARVGDGGGEGHGRAEARVGDGGGEGHGRAEARVGDGGGEGHGRAGWA